MENKIRVLVVDDSALMRKKLGAIIDSDEGCETAATCRDGEEAVRAVAALKPDVVMMDLQMPKMDGHAALKYIMSEWPTPVVMVSAFTHEGAAETIQCLEEGAVDFVTKPGGMISRNIEYVSGEILEKVKMAARANIKGLKPFLRRQGAAVKKEKGMPASKVVVIGTSTGGPRALTALLPQLGSGFPAGVLVVQHMPEGFTKPLAQRLNTECQLPVKEAEDGETIQEGHIFVAPAGYHMRGELRGKEPKCLKLEKASGHQILCPSADVTMKSVAPLFGKRCVGVVLTGMGNDGTEGLRAIKQFGGTTLAEAKESSIVYGMPKAAADAGVVDKVVPLSEMGREILKVVGK